MPQFTKSGIQKQRWTEKEGIYYRERVYRFLTTLDDIDLDWEIFTLNTISDVLI